MSKRWPPRLAPAISEKLNAADGAAVNQESDRALAYLLMRLTIGTSVFGHGLIRLPKLGAFHAQLTDEFKTSILPATLVSVSS